MIFFFFNDTATTEIYTLSLHDALPIFHSINHILGSWSELTIWKKIHLFFPNRFHGLKTGILKYFFGRFLFRIIGFPNRNDDKDRKSTRLNSSHANISYAVFCLKKKN